MAVEKRYFWLRLQHDFFQDKNIKKLRKLAGGDTYTVIYLKMQLKAILSDGLLTYTGIEPTFAEELALDIDEEPDNVAVTVNFLMACGLLEPSDDGSVFMLPYAVANTGKETEAAGRMREKRAQLKADESLRLEQCSNGCEQSSVNRTNNKEQITKNNNTEHRTKSGTKFHPPTLDEVQKYAKERESKVDPQKFFDYYEAGKWKDAKGNQVNNWKQKFLTWEGREKDASSKSVHGDSKPAPQKWHIEYAVGGPDESESY